MATSVGAVSMDLTLNKKNYNKQLNSTIKGTESAFSSSMKKIGMAIGGAFAVKQVVNFTKTCITSASKVQSAFTGLNSIVKGTGNSFATAQKFIKDYTSDGLISIEETATAYKNLLSRGYDTSQIENVLSRLKDSAAFGRQASYDLGEAVVSATEGLKNENSILVDNAGVTKNVAKMWEEYAKTHNTTTSAMTQAQKIEAEYNGIMKETQFQVGDAIAYTNTFAGQVQKSKATFTQMTVAIGKVVAPIAQLFIPIINSAMQAVTAFFEKLQGVLKVFGLEMPDVVSKSSSSFTNISSDIEGTGDSAISAAKKIKKAFAPIDEINVLNNNKTTDTSGGGSTSQSTSVPVTPTVAEDSTVSSAISATVEKIKKYIEPLQNINFDNLVNAFGRLKDAVAPITEKIFDGLSWVYFNVLVPLASWTIEDVLPAFLNILSGAFNILNTALTDIQPIFTWLWESILQPIASWTGGVIVSVLNGIGDALKWISENEVAMSIIEGITIVVGTLAGAIALYNAAMTVCNVVTGIFSGIMAVLTSPITLVVVAIGALIGIIILCVKHWEDIKNAAISCWEKIKEVWNVVATWFNDTIIQPIKNFFVGMWDGLKNGASNAWSGIKSVFSNVTNWFKDVFSKAWQAVKNVFSTGGKIFDGIKDGIANVFETVVNGIIKCINKVISIPFETINKTLNKIRNISFLNISPFKGLWKENPLTVPQIPMLEQGGWVAANNPQLAIVGDNKREGEVIAPESKIYDQVSKAIRDNNNVGKQEIELTIYHKYEDGRTIIQKINQAQIDEGRILVLT